VSELSYWEISSASKRRDEGKRDIYDVGKCHKVKLNSRKVSYWEVSSPKQTPYGGKRKGVPQLVGRKKKKPLERGVVSRPHDRSPVRNDKGSHARDHRRRGVIGVPALADIGTSKSII